MKPLILLVHQSADLYGSDKVLLSLVKGILDSGEFTPVVVVPESGALITILNALHVEVHVAEVGKLKRSVFTPKGLLHLPWRLAQAMRALTRIVNGRSIAVVHSNTLAVVGGALWARWHKVPHVWHIHEILLSPRVVSRGLTLLVRWLADTAMCNSMRTQQWLLAEQPSLARRSKVVFNGLPDQPEPSASAVAAFRQKAGAKSTDLVVTLLGRISRIKGQDVLIEAAGILHAEGRLGRLRFVVIGDAGPGQENLPAQLHARVRELHLENHFTFLQYEADPNIAWHGTDIAVVPSVEPESFGMVAIEAMAASRPVIASAHGGLLDIVIDNETGLLVPPNDAVALSEAINALSADQALRGSMGAAGRKRQQQLFHLDGQIDKTLKIYHHPNGSSTQV